MKNNLVKICLIFSLFGFVTGCGVAAVSAVAAGGKVLAQDKTVGETIDDTTIWTKIKNAYFQKDIDNLFSKVDVKVSEGRVLLTGSVPNQKARVEAVRLAWGVKGVKEVINELHVAVPTGELAIKSYSLDSWITTQIKTKLFFNKEVKSINYSIETIDQVVYLMGIASSQKELDNVTHIAGTIPNVKKVISYVRVKDAPNPTDGIYKD